MVNTVSRKRLAAADRQRSQKYEYLLSTVFRWAIGLAVFAVILLNVFTHVLQLVHYNGRGMEPGLKNGQTLLLVKTQKVKDGDTIAFYYNNQVLVRRVICQGGSQLMIEEDGSVIVNGQPLSEPYVKQASIGQCNITLPCYVPVNHVFVMGDQREIAMDSRLKEIGTIPLSRIIGKVIIAF